MEKASAAIRDRCSMKRSITEAGCRVGGLGLQVSLRPSTPNNALTPQVTHPTGGWKDEVSKERG
jgi:hypothetical protein